MECNHIGEVISADTQWLDVEAVKLHQAPRFGSFVRADCLGSGISYFGVVTAIATGPLDSQRVVQAFNLAPGELEQRLPHLGLLHRTTFRVRIVGYGEGTTRITGTPSGPPRLHCFVFPANSEDIRGVTGTPDFLRPLTQVADAPMEDLLVSCLRSAYEPWAEPRQMVSWAKYLARLLRRDYITLECVMERLQGVLPVPASAAPPAPRRSASKVEPIRTAPRWEKPLDLVSNGGYHVNPDDPFEGV